MPFQFICSIECRLWSSTWYIDTKYSMESDRQDSYLWCCLFVFVLCFSQVWRCLESLKCHEIATNWCQMRIFWRKKCQMNSSVEYASLRCVTNMKNSNVNCIKLRLFARINASIFSMCHLYNFWSCLLMSVFDRTQMKNRHHMNIIHTTVSIHIHIFFVYSIKNTYFVDFITRYQTNMNWYRGINDVWTVFRFFSLCSVSIPVISK